MHICRQRSECSQTAATTAFEARTLLQRSWALQLLLLRLQNAPAMLLDAVTAGFTIDPE